MAKFLIGFFIIFLGGLGVSVLASAGWYPVAIVGSDIIWAKTLNQATRAAVTYYRRLDAQITPAIEKELRRAILDKIVENVLISGELADSASVEQSLATQEAIAKYSQNPELGPAAAELYSLNLDEFYEIILTPQAERELLEKKLSANGQKIDDWLAAEKQAASVIKLLRD